MVGLAEDSTPGARTAKQMEYVGSLVSHAVVESLAKSGSQTAEENTSSPGKLSLPDFAETGEIQRRVIEDKGGVLRSFLTEEKAKVLAYTYRTDLGEEDALQGANDIDAASLHSKGLLIVLGKVVKSIHPEEDVSSKVSAVKNVRVGRGFGLFM